jgi:hypothetical protein
MRLEDCIFGSPPPRLPASKLDTVVTMLMLMPAIDVGKGLDGLRGRRYRIDAELITSLLDSTCDPQVHWIVVRSAAFPYLPPHLYRRLFFRFWPAQRTDAWRWALAFSLGAFLGSNPKEAKHYVRVVWQLAKDENENVALLGLSCARFLGDALTISDARRLVSLSYHPGVLATQALSVLNDLYRGVRTLRPDVRAYLLDDATISTLRKAPRDESDEDSAYNYCMAGIRKALASTRRRRTLKLVK